MAFSRRRRLAICLASVLVHALGCGGGGSSSSTADGGLDANVLWQQPERSAPVVTSIDLPRPRQQAGGGFGPNLPASVESVRFVFQSETGYRCCVSIDPAGVPRDPATGQRSVVLSNLPSGAGSLQVSGFPTATAAGPAGDVCPISPAGAGTACADDGTATPSFASDAKAVTIVRGVRSDAGDIFVYALPFIVPGSLGPAAGQSSENPVSVRFTVADAITGIAGDSIRAAVENVDGQLVLRPCDDTGATPCSENGRLGVRGFAVERAAESLALGLNDVDVAARNLADPARSLSLRYVFRAVGAVPSATRTATRPSVPTPTQTVAPTATERASRTATPTRTPTPEPAASATRTRRPTETPLAGTIAFVNAEEIVVSAGPEFLIAGRLDGDQLDDLVIVSPESREVDVLLGSATSPSRFNPGTVVALGTRLGAPALGDVNGDSVLDLLLADDAERGFWILIGRGDGSFQTPVLREVGRNPVAVAIADLDQTSNLDVAVADRSEDEIAILTNSGGTPPSFELRQPVDVERLPEVLLTTDFDMDGDPDLAVLSQGRDSVNVLSVILLDRVVSGFPLFSLPATVPVGQRAISPLAADLDEDGLPEIVLARRPSTTGNSELVIVPMQAGGVPGVDPIVTEIVCPFIASGASCPTTSLASADFDLDGDVDVVAALDDPRLSSGGDLLLVLQGQGTTALPAVASFTIARSARAIAAGDFNGDGLIDVAVAGRRDAVVQAMVNVTILADSP